MIQTNARWMALLPMAVWAAILPKTVGQETQVPKFELKEAWIGKLEMGIMEPVMQFRIGTAESGKNVARFDSITEGKGDFEATC